MDLHPEHDNDTFETNISTLSNEIEECGLGSDSFQVAVFIAGYITKKLCKKSKCEACISLLLKGDTSGTEYLNALSRGGLKIPPQSLSDHVSQCFAALEMVKENLQAKCSDNIRLAAERILKTIDAGNNRFMCKEHVEGIVAQVNRIIVNVFFNNQQIIENSSIRKDAVKT